MKHTKWAGIIVLVLSICGCEYFADSAQIRKSASAAYNKGNYAEAKGYYLKLTEGDSPKASDFLDLANCFDMLGSTDSALLSYKKCIELDPNYEEPYFHRGIVYRRLQKYDKAIADFSKAIKLYPPFHDAYYARGLTYAQIGNKEKAIADFREVVKLDPKHAEANKMLVALEN